MLGKQWETEKENCSIERQRKERWTLKASGRRSEFGGGEITVLKGVAETRAASPSICPRFAKKCGVDELIGAAGGWSTRARCREAMPHLETSPKGRPTGRSWSITTDPVRFTAWILHPVCSSILRTNRHCRSSRNRRTTLVESLKFLTPAANRTRCSMASTIDPGTAFCSGATRLGFRSSERILRAHRWSGMIGDVGNGNRRETFYRGNTLLNWQPM